MPTGKGISRSLFGDAGLERPISHPVCFERVGIAPQANGQAREVGGAQRGGLGHGWADDGQLQDVRLHLHEQVVAARPAIDAELVNEDLVR